MDQAIPDAVDDIGYSIALLKAPAYYYNSDY